MVNGSCFHFHYEISAGLLDGKDIYPMVESFYTSMESILAINMVKHMAQFILNALIIMTISVEQIQ